MQFCSLCIDGISGSSAEFPSLVTHARTHARQFPLSDALTLLPLLLSQVRALRASQRLHELVGGSNGLLVLPLHGGLPPAQQSKVFERPRPGVRKVCCAVKFLIVCKTTFIECAVKLANPQFVSPP